MHALLSAAEVTTEVTVHRSPGQVVVWTAGLVVLLVLLFVLLMRGRRRR
jgi:hypothetical protein